MKEAARNVTLVLICMFGILGAGFYGFRMWQTAGAYPDFSVFWTAGQVAIDDPLRIYDHAYLTERQSWLAPVSGGLRPWVNPPSALLLFVPFGLLPFWPAFCLWDAFSVTVFTFAARKLVGGWLLALAVFSPAVSMTLMWGQMSVLLGGLIIAGVVLLDERPTAAGLLLGLAASIKPQLLVLAPLALTSGRYWTPMLAFFAGGAAMVGTSLLVFGLQPWLEWVGALTGFLEIVKRNQLYDSVITPAGFAWGLGDGATVAITAVGAIAGIILAWWAFTRDEPEIRLTGLVCGGLLCSPYAMRYELAILAPAAVAVLFSAGNWRLLAGLTLISVPGWLAMIAMPASLIGFRRSSQ
jgi:hypothetical protein